MPKKDQHHRHWREFSWKSTILWENLNDKTSFHRFLFSQPLTGNSKFKIKISIIISRKDWLLLLLLLSPPRHSPPPPPPSHYIYIIYIAQPKKDSLVGGKYESQKNYYLVVDWLLFCLLNISNCHFWGMYWFWERYVNIELVVYNNSSAWF